MEPKHNNDYLPGTELPPLQEALGQSYGQERLPASSETRGGQPQTGAGSATGSVTGISPVVSFTPVHDNTAASAQSPSSQAATTGLVADDADLIEKEWVLKAKAIVSQTKSDPHEQNIQMNHIKADYIKKRYNKDLKVSGT